MFVILTPKPSFFGKLPFPIYNALNQHKNYAQQHKNVLLQASPSGHILIFKMALHFPPETGWPAEPLEILSE